MPAQVQYISFPSTFPNCIMGMQYWKKANFSWKVLSFCNERVDWLSFSFFLFGFLEKILIYTHTHAHKYIFPLFINCESKDKDFIASFQVYIDSNQTVTLFWFIYLFIFLFLIDKILKGKKERRRKIIFLNSLLFNSLKLLLERSKKNPRLKTVLKDILKLFFIF